MPQAITKENILHEMERLRKQPIQSTKGRLSQALKVINKEKEEEAADILTYIRAGWGLNDTPYPIQCFILKILYGLPFDENQKLDNLPARDEEGHVVSNDIIIWDMFREHEVGRYTEVDFLNKLYTEGRCTINYEMHKNRIGRKMNMSILRFGRRGGKTTLSQWIAAYEIYRLTRIYSPQDHYNTRKDQPIRLTLVSTSEDHARELLAPARAAIQRAPILKQYLASDSQDQVRLNTQRNMDLGVSASSGIKVAANACSARSLRGPANILVLLEEYGFFNSELKSIGRASNKTDREIYKAVAPSTGDFTVPGKDQPDSMIMVVSTPQTKRSHMFELEGLIREGKIQDGVVFWIPTYWINYTTSPSSFHREYQIDPIGYSQEYEADYLDNIESAFTEHVIDQCRVDPCGEYGIVLSGESTWMGMDLGLKNDGTTIFVVAANPTGETRLIHRETIRMGLKGYEAYVATTALSGDPLDYLDIAKIAKRIDYVWNYYGCQGGIFDQWNCILPSTLVTVEGGFQVRIDSLKVGDLVLTHKGRYRPILEVFSGETERPLLHFQIEGMPGLLSCTSQHRFLVLNKVTKNWEWKFSDQIKEGDFFHAQPIGNCELRCKVVKITSESYLGEVYDLNVEEDNSFMTNGIVAHNAYGLMSHLTGRCRDLLEHVEFNVTNNDHLARHTTSVINQKRLKIYATKEDWKDPESLLWELNHLERLETGSTIPKIRIQASNIKDRHDDQYSALSRALWAAKVGVEDETPATSVGVTPNNKRMADSLRSKAEQLRRAQNYQHGRRPPPRGFHRY